MFVQAEDDDATMARQRSKHTENREYEDPEEEEVERGKCPAKWRKAREYTVN
jgi:hypothetical protein